MFPPFISMILETLYSIFLGWSLAHRVAETKRAPVWDRQEKGWEIPWYSTSRPGSCFGYRGRQWRRLL